MMKSRALIKNLDPRAGLWLLVAANIGMFCEKSTEQGSVLSGMFLLLLLLYGQYMAAVARGIENPCPKSSAVQIRMSCLDWVLMALVTAGVVIVLVKM